MRIIARRFFGTAIFGLLVGQLMLPSSGLAQTATTEGAKSDTNNAMLAAEAYYTQNQVYPATVGDAGFTDSPQVTVAYSGDGVATPFSAAGTDGSGNCPRESLLLCPESFICNSA